MAPTHRRPDLRSVAARGAALHESLRGSSPAAFAAAVTAPLQSRSAEVARRITTWRDVAAGGDEARFAKRLRWDGLAIADAERMLGGPAADTAGEGLPPWIRTIVDAYGWTDGAPAVLSDDAYAGVIDAAEPLPFEELLLPLVEVARRRLAVDARDSLSGVAPGVLGGVLRGLLRRLTGICSLSLFADFSVHRSSRGTMGMAALFGAPPDAAPDAEYQSFIRTALGDRLVAYFDQYPVAARLCGTATDQWVAAMAEFFGRLHADAPELAQTFGNGGPLGTVESVKADAGDTHDGGRSVYLVRFTAGVTVVYKPRPIPLEQCFGDLVAWVNASGVGPDLRAPRRISRATHGWIEFVDFAPCADGAAAGRFYRRSGMLLALVYAANGTDFHLENLIAGGEYPVLIDMEALLSHRFELAEQSWDAPAAQQEALRLLKQSVLSTCLLPGNYMGQNGGMDIGGLAAVPGQELAPVGATWGDVNRDTMHIVTASAGMPERTRHAPVLDGERLDGASFIDEITAGFRAVYALLHRRRGELLAPGGLLEGMRQAPVRFLFRNTNLYATLLQRTMHPEYMRDGIDRGVQLEALVRPLLAGADRPASWPLLAAELRALERLDVPLFAARADRRTICVDSPEGAEHVECFRTTAFDQMTERVGALSDDDLERQVRFIRWAFLAARVSGLSIGQDANAGGGRRIRLQGTTRPRHFLDEAHRLAAHVLDSASIRGPEGRAWLGITYVPHARRYGVGGTGSALFDGVPGIALFLGALDHVDPTPCLRTAAKELAGMMMTDLGNFARLQDTKRAPDLGAGTGLGGFLYASVLLSRWLEMPELLTAATAAAATLTTASIAGDRTYGVLSGAGGGILGLLAVHRATGDPVALDRAMACGQHLLDARRPHRETRLRAWPTWEGRCDVGFVQGLGGIAAALQQLAAFSGGAEFGAAAVEAIALERVLARGTAAAAADTGAWCRGAVARGAARLGNPDVVNDPESLPEIEAAITTARASLGAGPDTLCSGAMGRVEFLLHAGQVLDRADLVTLARQAGAATLQSSRRGGGWRTPWDSVGTDVGFFHGLSGIGYACVRLAAPGRIPSVLHWSLDVAARKPISPCDDDAALPATRARVPAGVA